MWTSIKCHGIADNENFLSEITLHHIFVVVFVVCGVVVLVIIWCCLVFLTFELVVAMQITKTMDKVV